MDEARHVATGKRTSLAVSREGVLTLALCDRVHHHASGAVGGPHQILGPPILALRIESSLVVDLCDLAFDVAGMDRRTAHPRAVELGRKPLDAMRWEELWDTALRIRSAFLRSEVPEDLAAAVADAVELAEQNPSREGPGTGKARMRR